MAFDGIGSGKFQITRFEIRKNKMPKPNTHPPSAVSTKSISNLTDFSFKWTKKVVQKLHHSVFKNTPYPLIFRCKSTTMFSTEQRSDW